MIGKVFISEALAGGYSRYRPKVFETEELQVKYSEIKAYGWDL